MACFLTSPCQYLNQSLMIKCIQGHSPLSNFSRLLMNFIRSICSGVALSNLSWWRHQMETFIALLAICEGNSHVTGEFPAQRPVTRSFDVSFDLRLNKQLSKQSSGHWLETPSRPLWRHCNDYYMIKEQLDWIGFHLFNDTTRPAGHVIRPTQVGYVTAAYNGK